MDPDGVVRLVGAILRGTPSLPGAACRNHDPRLFDDRIEREIPAARIQRPELAREICHGCVERRRCLEAQSGILQGVPLPPFCLFSQFKHAAQLSIMRDYLQATGIPDIFDTIVGAGDTDHPKPAPDLCQETCRRLGVSCSRAVVLEDSLIGVQAARAAGTTVLAIPNLPGTRPIAHRSFPTLADSELWDVLGLTAAPDVGTVPPSRHPSANVQNGVATCPATQPT